MDNEYFEHEDEERKSEIIQIIGSDDDTKEIEKEEKMEKEHKAERVDMVAGR